MSAPCSLAGRTAAHLIIHIDLSGQDYCNISTAMCTVSFSGSGVAIRHDPEKDVHIAVEILQEFCPDRSICMIYLGVQRYDRLASTHP